jgi:chemotaxis protein CheD
MVTIGWTGQQQWWESQKVTKTVGIGEMKLSCDPNEILITYALGSCIALALYDPVQKIGGMIHCKLPTGEGMKLAQQNPYLYVDVGVPLMIKGLLKAGAQRNSIKVKIAGAASVLEGNDVFRIGEKNYRRMKEILKQEGFSFYQEHTGGSVPRTLMLYMDTGRTLVKTNQDYIDI